MAKKFDYDNEDTVSRKHKLKAFALNALIVAGAIAVFGFSMSALKEGLTAAAAEKKVESVRDVAVNSDTHEINFDVAKKLGCNAKSWLYIPDSGIDYPLVQAQDNDFYVDHDAYGNPSSSGAVFIHFGNAKDLSDAKTVIFGHNMLDDSMFANLKNYKDEEWGKAHPDAYFFLDDGRVRHARVRYYIYTDPYNENIYVTSKAEDPAVTAELLKNDASIVYDEYTGGRLMCLSTCTLHKYRTVVVFEEVDDKFPLITKGAKYFEESAADADLAPENGEDSPAAGLSDDSGEALDSVSAGDASADEDASGTEDALEESASGDELLDID